MSINKELYAITILSPCLGLFCDNNRLDVHYTLLNTLYQIKINNNKK